MVLWRQVLGCVLFGRLFWVLPQQESIKDNTRLRTTLIGAAPANVAKTDKLCLANFPLMSMFATATVEFNQKPVMPSNTLIAYTSQIRALQEYDKDGRAGILARSLW